MDNSRKKVIHFFKTLYIWKPGWSFTISF